MDKIYNYFDRRYGLGESNPDPESCGPIITISRQTGCDAIATASKLVDLLNSHYKTDKWHWVDKQILYEAAKELKAKKGEVERFSEGVELRGLSEMIMAISGDFISDLQIRKAIEEVVKSICVEGYAVLVGRGGVSITRGIKNALHIRLVAPFYWRVENIIKKRKYNIEDAEEFVVDTDEKRHHLILNFLDKKPLNIDYLFDAAINRCSFNIDQIAEIILQLYTRRIEKVKTELNNPDKSLHSTYG